MLRSACTLLLLIVALAGCGTSPPASTPPSTEPTIETSVTPTGTQPATATPRPSRTPSPTVTATPTPSPTPIATPTPTVTPTPTPAPPPPVSIFDVTYRNSHDGLGSSGQRESCIDVKIMDRNGRGIPGAQFNVNNGRDFHRRTTDSSGYNAVCELYGYTWSVVIEYIPNRPDPKGITTIHVNGAPDIRGGVNFRER